MEEIWRDIEGYKGLYQISNMGRVKSLGNGKSRNSDYSKERILKASINNSGYQFVGLSKEGKNNRYAVHHLVATAFCENPKGYTEVNHIDENKLNNRADNLEWCNKSYNLTYNGRAKKVAEKVAEKLRNDPKRSKPVIAISKESGLILEYPSTHEASRQTGIDQGNITRCCKGRRKSTGGYYWHYADSEEVANEK